MITLLDGKKTYEKQEVDTLLEPIQSAASEAKQATQSFESRKADKADVAQQVQSVKDDIPELVNDAINTVIDAKVQSVVPAVSDIVDQSITDKFNSAMATTEEVTAIVNQHF